MQKYKIPQKVRDLMLETSTEILDLMVSKLNKLENQEFATDFVMAVSLNVIGNMALRVYVSDPKDLKDPEKIAEVTATVTHELCKWFSGVFHEEKKQGMN